MSIGANLTQTEIEALEAERSLPVPPPAHGAALTAPVTPEAQPEAAVPPASVPPAHLKKKKPWRKKVDPARKFSSSFHKQLKYTDIERLPPIEIDEEGYPVRPPPLLSQSKHRLNEEQQKIRFLLMYNFSGGNITVSLIEAGVTRDSYDRWKIDPVFQARISQSHEEILDRLKLRVSQRVGLVRAPRGLKVNDAALVAMTRKYDPAFLQGTTVDEQRDEPTTEDEIPRPSKVNV